MQVLYDDDAVYFTAWLQRQFIRAGFLESASDCEELLQQLEDELDIASIAEYLYRNDDHIGAMQLILWPLDEKDWIRLSKLPDSILRLPFPHLFFSGFPLVYFYGTIEGATEFLREFIEEITETRRAEYWQLIREAASVLQEKEYKTPVPLNVVAAVSVLHRLVVVPKLNFEDLSRRLQRIVSSAGVAIVNDNGTVVLDRSKGESMDAEVRDYWKLFGTVEQEFADALAGSERVTDDELGLGRPIYESLEEVVNRQARGIATRVMTQIRQDRREA